MRKLEDPEYTQIWDAFSEAFKFRPSYGGPYPGIIEPDPSVTFELLDSYTDQDVDEFSEAIHKALQKCTTRNEEVYYLDWQHECYAFKPYQAEPNWFNGLPDGDYAIFLAPNLSFGSFGHPWEGTICFFGATFIAEMLRTAPRLLSKLKRSKGADDPRRTC